MKRLATSIVFTVLLCQSAPILAKDTPAPPPSQPTGKEEVAFRDVGRRDSKVWKNKEFEGDWDYKTNWEENPPAWLEGDDPFFHENPAAESKPVPISPHGDWDYEQNWQYQPGPYLRGEDQSQYNERQAHQQQNQNPSSNYRQYQYQQNQNQNRQPVQQDYEYVPGRGGTHTMPRQTVASNPPTSQGDWDYGEKWNTSRDSRNAYLSGENQAQYNERQFEKKRKNSQNRR